MAPKRSRKATKASGPQPALRRSSRLRARQEGVQAPQTTPASPPKVKKSGKGKGPAKGKGSAKGKGPARGKSAQVSKEPSNEQPPSKEAASPKDRKSASSRARGSGGRPVRSPAMDKTSSGRVSRNRSSSGRKQSSSKGTRSIRKAPSPTLPDRPDLPPTSQNRDSSLPDYEEYEDPEPAPVHIFPNPAGSGFVFGQLTITGHFPGTNLQPALARDQGSSSAQGTNNAGGNDAPNPVYPPIAAMQNADAHISLLSAIYTPGQTSSLPRNHPLQPSQPPSGSNQGDNPGEPVPSPSSQEQEEDNEIESSSAGPRPELPSAYGRSPSPMGNFYRIDAWNHQAAEPADQRRPSEESSRKRSTPMLPSSPELPRVTVAPNTLERFRNTPHSQLETYRARFRTNVHAATQAQNRLLEAITELRVSPMTYRPSIQLLRAEIESLQAQINRYQQASAAILQVLAEHRDGAEEQIIRESSQ